MENSPDIAKRLFCFGFGYTALALAKTLDKKNWSITGTSRSPKKIKALKSHGFQAHLFDRDKMESSYYHAFSKASHILISIPPEKYGDIVIDLHQHDLKNMNNITWIGYLSTTGVYGDTGGNLVSEKSTPAPTSDRSKRRLKAEHAWADLHKAYNTPLHIFRLPGIYGPGRSALDQVRAKTHKRIRKENHRFSRIHVDDIVSALAASINQPNPGVIYNVCDDEPAAPEAVTAFACKLLDAPVPPLIDWAEAQKTMTPMALSFWNDNRTIDNTFIKQDLGWKLKYPTFREGLRGILETDISAKGFS